MATTPKPKNYNVENDAFMAAWTARDAEVAELTAENERLQAQIAKGGTIVQKASDLALTTPFSLQQATESLTWTTDVWHQFKKAEADRNAALKALAESRARFGDSEARRAELEAVLDQARKWVWGADARDPWIAVLVEALSAAPSVVLEYRDRDREVAAQALEAMADEGERFMFGATGERMPADMDVEGIAPRWHEVRRLRERAAAIRKGNNA